MELTEIKRIVAAGIPGDRSNAEALAGDLIQMAIVNIGKMDGVDFNATRRTFSFVSGQAEYEIGSDIFNGVGDVISVQHVDLTDRIGSPVEMYPPDQFDAYASGSSISGRPVIGKVYFKNKKPHFKVYPNPDSAYSAEATVRFAIDSIEDIPDHHHPTVVTTALEYAAALANGTLASLLAKQGMQGLVDDSLGKWDGSVIQVARHLGLSDKAIGADSGNLRP